MSTILTHPWLYIFTSANGMPTAMTHFAWMKSYATQIITCFTNGIVCAISKISEYHWRIRAVLAAHAKESERVANEKSFSVHTQSSTAGKNQAKMFETHSERIFSGLLFGEIVSFCGLWWTFCCHFADAVWNFFHFSCWHSAIFKLCENFRNKPIRLNQLLQRLYENTFIHDGNTKN